MSWGGTQSLMWCILSKSDKRDCRVLFLLEREACLAQPCRCWPSAAGRLRSLALRPAPSRCLGRRVFSEVSGCAYIAVHCLWGKYVGGWMGNGVAVVGLVSLTHLAAHNVESRIMWWLLALACCWCMEVGRDEISKGFCPMNRGRDGNGRAHPKGFGAPPLSPRTGILRREYSVCVPGGHVG